MTKRGIILFNLGGPTELKDVKPFLNKLFSDPDILVGIPTPFRQALAFFIAQVKGPASIELYRKIGGGSPQLRWTQAQAGLLARELLDHPVPTKIVIGMRASEPSIETSLKELKQWGATEIVLLPLFPQFSTTTTGSCFKEVRRILNKWKWHPALHEVRSWADNSHYIELLKQTLNEAIAAGQLGAGAQPLHILFSAHSLPMKIIDRGDNYPAEIAQTIAAVSKDLVHPWSVSFQSRNGKMPWLEPYTEDELERLGKLGVRHIVVVPVSFVSDHIETLYELDQLYADHARAHGIEGYYRARSFNDDPGFGRVLHSALKTAAPATSPELMLKR